ncbi:PAS domain S-box protein [Thiovibrio frasassiensis]|uniref:histidine kinase n=1 Tax=Thiovibrio frasassiensis TaxID=2984131 RepID=A0A9X4MFX5_9BACT|nr:PAS domain S-box protein [Thiovibrio frasassiensis]MDG4475515.1 PAS domain S-box protein [Thiovibrio frasassiensis]
MISIPRRDRLLRSLFSCLLLLFLFFTSVPLSQAGLADGTVRVGLFENKPMCYTDAAGKPAGIFVTVLEYAAKQEGWRVEYVRGTFPELFTRLARGEIDIFLSMAVSEERSQFYAFNKSNVFNNWAVVYAKNGADIHSLLDLKGKRVAGLARGIFTSGPESIMSLSDRFQLKIELLPLAEYGLALKAVRQGRADAAVVNRLTGLNSAAAEGLVQTGIVFAPVNVRFALNKNSPDTPALIRALDRHFKTLQETPNSSYHKAVAQAIGADAHAVRVPEWIKVAFFGFCGVITVLAIFAIFLRWQINRKTVELREANARMSADMEQRRAVEMALLQSEERFRSLVENSSDWIWEFDENEIFTFSSPRVRELLGYEPDEVIGKSAFFFIPEGEREAVARDFLLAKEARLPFSNLLNVNRHKDGHLVSIESSGVPVFDGEGTFRGYRGIDRDISERKNMEAQLCQAYKMEAIGTLAGGIAHDFNNILAAILGYTELARLEIGKAEHPAQQSLQEVLKAGLRAKDLVQQILAFSRKSEQEMGGVQIAPLVKEALKLLRALIPTTIEMKQEISEDLWDILADPTQIHQVIMNLCTNAVQAMEPDGGVLFVRLQNVDNTSTGRRDLGPGCYVQLSVSDSGMGIEPELQKRIFDPYFTTKGLGRGTGMGLAVVHGIVKSHHGLIQMESVPGQGTTFQVFFPRAEKTSTVECVSTAEIPTGTERILLVDDEPSLADVGKRLLEKYGYAVTAKYSSLEAYEAFRCNPADFDLLITDLTMPDLTGLELAREVRAISPQMPIILCSGNNQKVEDAVLQEAGISASVLKPLTGVDLACQARRILDAAAL